MKLKHLVVSGGVGGRGMNPSELDVFHTVSVRSHVLESRGTDVSVSAEWSHHTFCDSWQCLIKGITSSTLITHMDPAD